MLVIVTKEEVVENAGDDDNLRSNLALIPYI